jgi:hypothetical protein
MRAVIIVALGLVALDVIVGAVLWWKGRHLLQPGGPITTQPTAVVLKDRPVPGPVRWRTAVVSHPVPSANTATQGTPDTARVRAFARAVFTAESLRAVIARLTPGDTTTVDTSAISKGLPPIAGRYTGRDLTLWISRADGSVLRSTARLRPHWEFQASQGDQLDTVPSYREDRWWLRTAREAAGCLPRGALLGGAGWLADPHDRTRGALLAATAGILGCLAD